MSSTMSMTDLDSILDLLDAPLLAAWRGLRDLRLAADRAWFDALEADDQETIGAAIDRHLACLTVQTGLTLRLQDAGPLALDACGELLDLVAPDARPAVEARLADALDHATDDELVAFAEASLRAPHRRGTSGRLVSTLVERGHIDRATRALRDIDHVHTHLDVAERLSPHLDDPARTVVARHAWQLIDADRTLDPFGEYGAAVSYATRLRAVALWPAGAPEALARLRLLEHHLTFITPHEWGGSQDHQDLRMLLARVWSHHGDVSRATHWYEAIGEHRRHWLAELVEVLPEAEASARVVEALRDAMQQYRAELAGRGQTRIWPPTELGLLDALAPTRAVTLLATVDEVFDAGDPHGELWRIAFVPHLPLEQARALWCAQLDALPGHDPDPSFDARLELLVDSMGSPGDVRDEVAALLRRWPRPDPFDGLEQSWPNGDLSEPLNVLLSRPDTAPSNGWGRLVDDLVASDPALSQQLPADWPVASPSRKPAPRPIWVEPSTVEHLLRELPAEDQRAGLAIYAATLASKWTPQDTRDALSRLQTPPEPWQPSPGGQPRRAWRALVDDCLADDDLTSLEGLFGLFAPHDATGTQNPTWLTWRLLDAPPALARWLTWLRNHRDPLRVTSILGTVLARQVGSPPARRACLDALEAAARTALGRRAAPDTQTFYAWGSVIRWASDDVVRHLWSRRCCGRSGGRVAFAELQMAVRLGGVQRLRAAFEALRRASTAPHGA